MLSINFLLDLSIILLTTKVLGLITKKIHMPQVVGALLAGIIFGPALFNVVRETDFISKLAELGVIVLMFNAGLETDLGQLKKCGKAAVVIAAAGVILPLTGGFCLAAIYSRGGSTFDLTSQTFLKNLFIGVILTATSVSITVETLQEMGKLKTAAGTAIMGAAVIDDIIGIVILTIITGSMDTTINSSIVLLKIVIFFFLAAAVGYIFRYAFNWLCKTQGQKRRVPLLALVFCLLLAFLSESLFGVADITGAYIAGIVLANTPQAEYIQKKFEVISYMLLSPIFFASVGLSTVIGGMNKSIVLCTITLLLIAIITKVLGCGAGARLCGYSKEDSVRIGVGMVSRGEVALIVANKGAALGLINKVFFAPIILVVILTTLITPILLKVAFRRVGVDMNAAI
jgi:Kef-type K+ transport system membrane component KefB